MVDIKRMNLVDLPHTDPKKVDPKHGWVLIERDHREEKVGSILLPDQAKKVTNRGRVISAAKVAYDDETGDKIDVEVVAGDYVIFVSNNIRPAEFGKKKGDPAEYVFVPYYSILGVIKD